MGLLLLIVLVLLPLGGLPRWSYSAQVGQWSERPAWPGPGGGADPRAVGPHPAWTLGQRLATLSRHPRRHLANVTSTAVWSGNPRFEFVQTQRQEATMAKKSRGGRMTAAKKRAAAKSGGKGLIKNRTVGKKIMKT